MFQSDITSQKQLFAFTYRDLVPEDCDVWLYVDLFESLDFQDFDVRYSSQGQEAKEPRHMVRTIFYALTHGIVSGRRLAESCLHDNRFIVLSGGRRPDRRTFDRFLVRHGDDLDCLFVEIVKLAQNMGLVKLGRIAIDGSKFKANADRSMRYDAMERAIGYIKEELAQLKRDLAESLSTETSAIDDKLDDTIKCKEARLTKIRQAKEQIDKEFASQVSKESKKAKRKPKACKALHDVEALSLGAGSKFSFGYNVQAAVDERSQIIVAADLATSANDSQSLPSLMDQVKENCGSYPSETLADAGYQSLANIEAVKVRGSKPIIAFGQESKEIPEHVVEQVRKAEDEGDRTYYCLNERKLPLAHLLLPPAFGGV